MMDAKAVVELDGQELELLIRSAIRRADLYQLIGKDFESRQHLILASKLANTKHRFHQEQYAMFAARYQWEEKKGSRQIFQFVGKVKDLKEALKVAMEKEKAAAGQEQTA